MSRKANQAVGRFRIRQAIPSRGVRLALYFAFWTLMGALNAASEVIGLQDDPRFAVWEPVVWEMTSLYTTGLLCPLIVYFTRRLPFSWDSWLGPLTAHLGLMVLFSLAHSGGMVAMRKTVYWAVGDSYTFGGGELGLQLLYEFYKDIRLYWIIVFLSLGFEFYNKYRERELEASQLKTRLVEAQLVNLKHQLNPHFLFNTLHAISSHVHTHPEKADRMIAQLSDLLRLALRSSARQEVTLEEELQGLRLYVEIMKARFEGDVQLRMNIDPGSLDALVPNLLLQPLVENAFRHGISKRSEGGAVEVSTAIENGLLQLRVKDNGPGAEEALPTLLQKGIGLSSAAERLRGLYGEAHRLRAANLKPGEGLPPFETGFEVTVEIPLRRDSAGGGPDPSSKRQINGEHRPSPDKPLRWEPKE